MLKRKFSLKINLEDTYLAFLQQTTVRKKKHQNGLNTSKHLQYDHMITPKNFNHHLKGVSHLFNSKTKGTTGTQCTVHKAFPGTSISKNWLAKTSSAKERIQLLFRTVHSYNLCTAQTGFQQNSLEKPILFSN